jgi:cytochrome c peroxidase
MKNKISTTMFAISTIILAMQACKNDEDLIMSPEPHYNPTSVTLNIPSFATTYLGNMLVPPTNPLTAEGILLGRKLFYEKMLSNDLSMSCASCHIQENAFNDPKQFSQGTNGAFGDRNAMSIINLGFSPQLFWDGRRNSIEEQAHDPVTNNTEMRNNWSTVVQRLQADKNYPSLFFYAFGSYTIDSNLVTKAIAQFERTMLSFNSPFDNFFYGGDTTLLNASQKRGYNLFFGKAECVHCHSGPLLTDNLFKNNGLDNFITDIGYGKTTGKTSDNGKFKVPTLRNIAQSAPYMHDGRFTTLEQVVEHYNSGVIGTSPNLDPDMIPFTTGLNLSTQEKADLVNFLKTFTDNEFLTNTKFKDPN